MRRSLLPLLLGLLPVASIGQECIRPVVAPAFGVPVVVTAEFVAKPNTYYAQNIVAEPFFLKVVSVDGRVLPAAVVIEYRLETSRKVAQQLVRADSVQEFEAYETLFQPAFANPWLPEGEQGMGFALCHLLHIRPGKGRAAFDKPRRATPAEPPSTPPPPEGQHP